MTTALLVIDVQESFRARPAGWATASAPDIADRIARLVTHARAAGQRVRGILHTEPGSGGPFDPESGHVRLIDGLAAAAGEPVLRKTSHNAFTTTGLAQDLTTHGVAEGIASGIDLALHLIATDHGPAVAARVARSLVVPTRRNGSAPRESAMLRHSDHLADVVHRVQDVLDARFTEPLPLDALARTVGVSERTLSRLFVAATGRTPLRYQQELRLERAERLVANGWTRQAAAPRRGLRRRPDAAQAARRTLTRWSASPG